MSDKKKKETLQWTLAIGSYLILTFFGLWAVVDHFRNLPPDPPSPLSLAEIACQKRGMVLMSNTTWVTVKQYTVSFLCKDKEGRVYALPESSN